MRLLPTKEYKKVEHILRNFTDYKELANYEIINKAINEIIAFFDLADYDKLLDLFYIHRNKYKYRLPTNTSIFIYLSDNLKIPKYTLYSMRKEIIYKSAMIFYKYNLL